MKVNFPNRLGHASTSPEQVDLLSSQFGFSAAYSDFLKNQNGFNFSDLESISETAEILTGDPESSEGKSDLRVLYSIGTEDPYYDLEIKISDPFATFGGAFFPIGEGYGGNLFVEVLHGEKKGGGFKSEVQHLLSDKVSRCQVRPRHTANSSLKTG